MGFVYEPDTYLLEFADPKMAGFEMRVRELSLGELQELGKYAGGNFRLNLGNLDEFDKLLEFLVTNITSWNLEDKDHKPRPVSVETIRALDPKFFSKMITAWMDVVSGVEAELGKESSSGETQPPPEASLPMEALSASPPS